MKKSKKEPVEHTDEYIKLHSGWVRLVLNNKTGLKWEEFKKENEK